MPSDAPQDGAPAPKVDFTSALAKVKAIAAKLGSSASTSAPAIPAATAPSTGAPPMMKRPYEDDSYGLGGHGGHDSRGDDNHYGKRMAYDSGRDSGPMHRPGLGSQVSHYAPPMRNEHQVQEEMGVPGNLVGLIIGRGGENLKRIERETGCKVQFSQDGSSNDRERFVNIVGQPAGIADARRQIQEIITSSQTGERPGGYGGYGGGGNYGMGGGDGYGRGGSSSTIQIPSTKVGLVIGRRGETIRDLQDRSGARIAVTPTPQDHNSPSRTVTITGDDSAIERAKTFIDEIVNDMAPRGAYGGGGYQNTPPVTMTVPQESIGLVIGRGGETVKQLQIQSRAKIQVQQVDPSVPAPVERTINLFGPPEAVEYAKQLIMEKVNGARDNDRYGGRDQGGYGVSSGGYGGGYGGYNQQQSYQQPAQSAAAGYGQQYGSGYGAAAAPAATPAASTYTPEQQAAYAQYYGYQYGSAAAVPGADATAASSAAATPAVGADTSSYGTYDYSRYGQYGTTAAASSATPATSSAVVAVTPTPAAVAAPTSDAAATSSAAAPAAASAAGGAAAPDYSAYYAQQEAYQQYYSQYYGYQAPAADGSAPAAVGAGAAAANGGSDASATASASGSADKSDASSSNAVATDSTKGQ
ncbi:hypothetical protein BG015_009272 [Linnemannia schmuckeri]|uniref:K Homology domain-containing protein n=1 Tax=Linnemannia schmuckeri TaxID=64567 RepID=A0A9P5VA28_9FUNG|nr:hypothetical protein BG015_009272 [Linnemannia schmuckeri]